MTPLNLKFGSSSGGIYKLVPSYTLYKTGSNYYAMDEDGGNLSTSATPLTVLQAAHDALPTAGGIIHIKPPFYTTGTFNWSKSNLTLKTDLYRHIISQTDNGLGVVINKILVSNATASVDDFAIDGIQINELDFYNQGYPIKGGNIRNCGMYVTGANNGIIFRDNGVNSANYTEHLRFDNLAFYKSNDVTGYGAITFQGHNWGNCLYFKNCRFEQWDTPATFIYVADGAKIDFLDFHALSFTDAASGQIFKFFYMPAITTDTYFGNITVQANPFELHGSGTFVTIPHPSGGASLNGRIIIYDSVIEMSTNPTITLISNAAVNADWMQGASGVGHGFQFKDNITAGVGSVVRGTDGACARFKVDVSSKVGIYTTEGHGSSTGTDGQQTIAHGLAITPNRVIITPTVTGAAVTNVWADATNIYCTVTTGKTYNWTAENV